MDIQRDSIFPIEVFQIALHNSDEINNNILTQLYASVEYKEYSKNKLTYKNFSVPATKMNTVQYVLMRATSIIKSLTKQTLKIDDNNWWFNIMQAGQLIKAHNHSPGPVWSGVYYVKAPAGSGKICFTHSRTHIKEPTILPSGKKTNYYKYIGQHYPDKSYPATEGTMLIYPSWLDHKVSMHCVPESRIAISFNLTYPFAIL